MYSGQIWEHHSGRQYELLFVANTAHASDKFPPTVVYRGTNWQVWSRPLDTWTPDKFTLVPGIGWAASENEGWEPTTALEHSLALGEVRGEVARASRLWPRFNSAHEAFAVLDEERDELWSHVKTKQSLRDLEDMRNEAIQVAAMAVRFAAEVCDAETGRK